MSQYVGTTVALLVGTGAKTLTPRDALEAAVNVWLTTGTSALASTGRPFECVRVCVMCVGVRVCVFVFMLIC